MGYVVLIWKKYEVGQIVWDFLTAFFSGHGVIVLMLLLSSWFDFLFWDLLCLVIWKAHAVSGDFYLPYFW